MGVSNILNTGKSGLMAAKTSIAATGHNIANANTEGYTRQRTQQTSVAPVPIKGVSQRVGSGVLVNRVERINDAYVDKQVREAGRDLAHFEEKEVLLRQTEDIFNEMGGEGLNRLMAKFFNEFRKLGNEPENEAIRQSVREATQAVVNDIKRIRSLVSDVQSHVDAKLDGYAKEATSLTQDIKDLNLRIQVQETSGQPANDLLDKRDHALKRLNALFDIAAYTDNQGLLNIDLRDVGPLVTGPIAQSFSTERVKADPEKGIPENAFQLRTTAAAGGDITHQIKGGAVGALIEVRDQTLSSILNRLDNLAFNLAHSVNEIHRQGFTRTGQQGIDFFKAPVQIEGAAELLSLSDAIQENTNNIATAAAPDSPGDNRIAVAISSLQGAKIMNGGAVTVDDWYNSIISDVGIIANKNKSDIGQQKDIVNQLSKVRERISGVSLDEEAMNLVQFQHAFDASAKVIQVADELLKTVLDMRR